MDKTQALVKHVCTCEVKGDNVRWSSDGHDLINTHVIQHTC